MADCEHGMPVCRGCARRRGWAPEVIALRKRVEELEKAGRGIIGKRIKHSGYCATVKCDCPPEDAAFFRAFGECPTCKDGGGCVDCRKDKPQGGGKP